jgi:hypothetical protein
MCAFGDDKNDLESVNHTANVAYPETNPQLTSQDLSPKRLPIRQTPIGGGEKSAKC